MAVGTIAGVPVPLAGRCAGADEVPDLARFEGRTVYGARPDALSLPMDDARGGAPDQLVVFPCEHLRQIAHRPLAVDDRAGLDRQPPVERAEAP